MKRTGWRFPPVGAKRAAEIARSSTAFGTGSDRNARQVFVLRIASRSSMRAPSAAVHIPISLGYPTLMQDFEKLGAFYLGRVFDLEQGKPKDDLVLYDSGDLTTHAVIVGMTGSGKTGL